MLVQTGPRKPPGHLALLSPASRYFSSPLFSINYVWDVLRWEFGTISSTPVEWTSFKSQALNINAVHKEEQDKNKFCAAPLGKSRHEKNKLRRLSPRTLGRRVCAWPPPCRPPLWPSRWRRSRLCHCLCRRCLGWGGRRRTWGLRRSEDVGDERKTKRFEMTAVFSSPPCSLWL